ncbi:hypothetical protein BC831DRAFT_511793 [Entophlyctis helioformis]|nr:hypothetical protein BC831DRAFT_511793 [Entophlyctis helioformis]
MSELELFAWGPGLDQPSFDPFCLSIAAYLNMAGELPLLRVGVEPVVGTFNIIRTLKSKGIDLDTGLSDREKAESQAFIALIENKLYDALLYTFWMEGANYNKSIQPTLSQSLTFFDYRDVQVKGETIPEVYLNAREAYRALADKLGDKPYFFGDRPSSLDAIAYGHLAVHVFPSLAVPKLFSLLTFEFPTLIAYCARLKGEIPLTRPSMRSMVSDFVKDPEPYLRFVWEGFQTKMVPVTEKKTKEQRVQAFWKGVSVVAAVGFFVGFVASNGLVQISIEDDNAGDVIGNSNSSS